MYPFCYFNGKYIQTSEAAISINDLAVVRGFAVFDFLRTYNLKPFRVHQYIKRFFSSMAALGMEVSERPRELAGIVDELLNKNEIKEEAGVRLVMTGGPSGNCFSLQKGILYIMVEPLHHQPAENYSMGIQLLTQNFQRQFPAIKTTNYMNAVLQFNNMQVQSFQDILYLWQGMILETPRSNFFMVRGEELITPGENILIGCTRDFVIELAVKSGLKVNERNLPFLELQYATEAFITGTTKNITPVVKINDEIIGEGKPAEVTKSLMAAFNKAVAEW